MTTTVTSAPVRLAAGVVVRRRRDGAVLLGARTEKARSWPGTLAFPGGSVDDGDAHIPTLDHTADPARKHLRVAALREALEEAGFVRLATADGVVASTTATSAVVAGLAAGEDFGALLQRSQLVVDDRDLIDLGSWLTAEGSFLVARFLIHVDEAPPLVTPPTEELAGVAFQDPTALMAGWRDGSVFLPPPIRTQVGRLAETIASAAAAAAVQTRLAAPPTEPERRRRDIVCGVILADFRSPTLPPATTTNCTILGGGDVLLVDPATPFADERARFDEYLEVVLEGRKVAGVFLTHHHPDHIGDAERLRAKHRCPIYAHAETVARLDFSVDVVVDDGHVFELPAGSGGPVRRFQAVWTPGHAPGHLCLFEPSLRLLLAGDMVAGVGSILIDPTDGHMATYLASLDRLIALKPRSLVPAHGPLLTDAVGRLEAQKTHRLAREAMVLAAITSGARDVDGVVLAVYGADTPPAMMAFAGLSVRSILTKLVEDEAIVEDKTGLRLAG